MKLKILNEKGFTLAELMISVFLVALLGYGFAMAMLQFVIGFQETRDFILLQQDMIAVMNIIRKGHAIEGVHDNAYNNYPIVGLLTAQRVSFSYSRDSITMSPVRGEETLNRQWVRVRLEPNTGRVITDYQFGAQSKYGVIVFPTVKERINRENRYRITRLEFVNLTPGLEQPQLVRVIMEGQVRFRERGRTNRRRLMTVEQDQQMNVRRVIYETTVYVGNADKYE